MPLAEIWPSSMREQTADVSYDKNDVVDGLIKLLREHASELRR
jgi:hypothetical protein